MPLSKLSKRKANAVQSPSSSTAFKKLPFWPSPLTSPTVFEYASIIAQKTFDHGSPLPTPREIMYLPGKLYIYKPPSDSPLYREGAAFIACNIAGEDLTPVVYVVVPIGTPCMFLKNPYKDEVLFLYGEHILGTNEEYWERCFHDEQPAG